MKQDVNIQRDVCFIQTKAGRLFSIFYHPAPGSPVSGNIVYIHPFADEMNKSRRMAALQAKAFAESGFGVLQIDLYGCGDSQGEFCDVTWEIWKNNIQDAVQWLLAREHSQISLWGVRLGALLMMDWIKSSPVPIDRLIFWQPVLNGSVMINQFLRLASASQMMGKHGTSVRNVREKLNRGETVEVGGYELNPDFVNAVEAIKMNNLIPPKGSRVIWKEISIGDQSEISLASQKIVTFFKDNRCKVDVECIRGNYFWNSVEIATIPDLIRSTTVSMLAADHEH